MATTKSGLPRFEPGRCDLCSDTAFSPLIELTSGRAMLSDRRTVAANLEKVVCATCGLVRAHGDALPDALEEFYRDDYRAAWRPEHSFHSARGPITRSAALADWMGDIVPAGKVLEVGCGGGLLMAELRRRLGPDGPQIEGMELSRVAAAQAERRGFTVHRQSLAEISGRDYDFVYAITTLEHVASPTAFLHDIRGVMRPGAKLLLIQPTQDVESYDVLFLDHLHHFGTEHLEAFARKCGFRCVESRIGRGPMKNFGRHVWELAGADPGRPDAGTFSWTGPPAETLSKRSAVRVLDDMARLDVLLARLARGRNAVGVFGLQEVYWLARSYSGLGNAPIACGMDDEPDKEEYADLEFPVVRPEQCLDYGVRDVILAMNKVYYEQVRRRLEPTGVRLHPVLS